MNQPVWRPQVVEQEQDDLDRVYWVEARGRLSKFYHREKVCIEQLDAENLVSGEEREARRRGVTLCPDCERVHRARLEAVTQLEQQIAGMESALVGLREDLERARAVAAKGWR